MGFLSKWRLLRSKCTCCHAKIPDTDIVNALSQDSWQKASTLLCKKCRGEGAYYDRCPICNNGRIMDIEDRSFSSEELERMHKKCLEYLLNDWKYQYGFHYNKTIENLTQICERCGQYIFRENAECPFCKNKQNEYKKNKRIIKGIAEKEGNLVKRKIERVGKAKKRQLEVVMGDNDNVKIDAISELLQKRIGNRYNLTITSSFYAEEILELAENGSVDIFILTLNNIYYPSDHLEKSLQLITKIKKKCEKPVIALSGLTVEEASFVARAKPVADFFLMLPLKFDMLMDAVEKCLDKLPEIEETTRIGPKVRYNS